MSSRYLLPFFLAAVAWVSTPAVADEHQLADQLPSASRVVIATPEETVDLREAGRATFAVDRALRGRGRKGETLVVTHDGGLGTAQFEKGRQYLVLLQPGLDDATSWTHVGSSALPYVDGNVQFPPDGDVPAASVDLSTLLGLIDRYAPSPDAMLAVRTSLNGRWALTLTMNGRDLPMWVLDARQDGDDVSAEILAMSPQFETSRVDSFTVSDAGQVNLRIVATSVDLVGDRIFDFQGTLQDGAVVGNCITDGNSVRIAKLRATGARNIIETGGVKPAAESKAFEDAVNAEDEYAAYQQFVKDHADVPLALNAYLRMLTSETAAGLSEEEVDELAKAYLANSKQWGERMQNEALVELAVSLAESKHHPQLALRYLQQAEPLLTETAPQSWTKLVPYHLAKMLYATGNVAEAAKRLKEFHAANPFEPVAAFYAARILEENGDLDDALQVYAELSVLPGLIEILKESMGPDVDSMDQKVLTLWKKQRAQQGDRNEFVEYIVGIYRDVISGLSTNKFEPQPPQPGTQTRVPLVELFTNAEAAYAVAADVALSGLTRDIPSSNLVVLRYHIATKEPDVLAGTECHLRIGDYQSKTIPSLYFNGKEVPSAGKGNLAPASYREFRKLVEPLLHETSDIELKLSAAVEGETIVLSAEALREKPFGDQMRLRLALIEEAVGDAAKNGVKLHENLVRIMPGGFGGIAPQDGKLSYHTDLTLEDYRKQLNDNLTAYEEYKSDSTGEEFYYHHRPIGPIKLKLVAFVQDEVTKEVLQSAMIDIKGFSAEDSPEKPEPPAEETPKTEATE